MNQHDIIPNLIKKIQEVYKNNPQKLAKKRKQWQQFQQQISVKNKNYYEYMDDQQHNERQAIQYAISTQQNEKKIKTAQNKYASKPQDCPEQEWPFFPEQEQKRGRFGRTELHDACYNGNIDQVNRLLAIGSNINAVDNFGNIPIELAVMQGHQKIVQLFKNKNLV